MSEKPNLDLEQLMQMQRIMQSMQPQPPAAPAGAITGNGIVKWQTIIIWVIASMVLVAGFLIRTSADGAKEFNTIVTTLDRHEKLLTEKADKRDFESLDRQAKALTEDKADKKDVSAIKEKLDENSKSTSELKSVLLGLSSQVSALAQEFRNMQGRGR